MPNMERDEAFQDDEVHYGASKTLSKDPTSVLAPTMQRPRQTSAFTILPELARSRSPQVPASQRAVHRTYHARRHGTHGRCHARRSSPLAGKTEIRGPADPLRSQEGGPQRTAGRARANDLRLGQFLKAMPI